MYKIALIKNLFVYITSIRLATVVCTICKLTTNYKNKSLNNLKPFDVNILNCDTIRLNARLKIVQLENTYIKNNK